MIDMSPIRALSNRTNPEVNTVEVYVPDGTTKIPDNFFSECKNIKNIYIPDSVVSIGGAAFRDCSSLKSIRLPSGLKEIGYMAFWNCTNLRNIVIPDAVTKIGNDAFNGAGLETVTLPSQLEVLEECVFCNCKALHNITIPDSIKEIHNRAFWGSGLRSIRIPASVKVVGEGTFNFCDQLSDVTICNPSTAFVKCTYPMFGHNDETCNLHGEGFTIPGATNTKKKALVFGGLVLMVLLCNPLTTIAVLIVAHFLLKKKHGLGLFDIKGLSKIYFTRPWYERIPVVDGMKEVLPYHLLFDHTNSCKK